jgi:hypothetical protein
LSACSHGYPLFGCSWCRYDRTGSVLLAVLMHASLLAVQMVLEPSTESEAVLLAVPLALGVVMWGFVAALAKRGALLPKGVRRV